MSLLAYRKMSPDDKRAFLRFKEDCEICGQRAHLLVVDHDHESGFVRGALCERCNCMLPKKRERAFIGAANYLKRFRFRLEAEQRARALADEDGIPYEIALADERGHLFDLAVHSLAHDLGFSSSEARGFLLAIRQRRTLCDSAWGERAQP